MGIEIRPMGGQTTAAEAAGMTRAPIDATSRLIVAAGVATAVIALAGGLLGAWRMDWLGLVMVAAGMAATGVAWRRATADGATDLDGRDIELGTGVMAGVISVTGLLELPFELARLDERGGVVGAALTVALAVSSLALLAGAVRRWTSVSDILGGPDRGVRLAYTGVGLVVVGWLANVTIGAWTLSAGVGVLTWIMLAALVLRWSSDPAADGLPVAGAWIAVVCAVIATLLGLDHLMAFVGQAATFGPLDWLAMLPYGAGVAMTLVGAVWTAYERTMDAQERSTVGGGDLG